MALKQITPQDMEDMSEMEPPDNCDGTCSRNGGGMMEDETGEGPHDESMEDE